MKNLSKKTKAIIILIIILVITISIFIVNGIVRNNRITEEATDIAKSYGLKNIKISIGGKVPGYSFHNVTIECTNLESLSYSDMYSLDSSLSFVDDAYVSEYISNGNTYKIYPSTKSIYKNDIQIHDDYYNSASYKVATKNKYNNSNYKTTTSSRSSYSSSNSSGYTKKNYSKPSTSEDKYDKYNVYDYKDAEDFYYDNYDDFFEYEDAEDYFNEHKD